MANPDNEEFAQMIVAELVARAVEAERAACEQIAREHAKGVDPLLPYVSACTRIADAIAARRKP